jgi:hypothetical protein
MSKKQNDVQKQLKQLLNNNNNKQGAKKQGSTKQTNNNQNNARAVAPYIPIDNTMLSVEEFQKNAIKATTPKTPSAPQVPANQPATITPGYTTTAAPPAFEAQPTYVAPKQSKPSSEQQDTLGGMIFWMFLVLLIIGGGVLLFFIMRGKFKSIEKDIRGLDNQPVDLGPLQRDIQRVSTDVKKLEEEWDTDMTDIEYVKKLYEEKGKP